MPKLFAAAAASLLIVAMLCAETKAHITHFANHPEWNNLWPEERDAPADIEVASLPDLSGLWTGSPAGGATHRYWFTASGGGYGTAKDTARDAPARPGTTYEVACLTDDWHGGSPGGCGWNAAECKVSSNLPQLARQLRLSHEDVFDMLKSKPFHHWLDAQINVTCTFDGSNPKVGALLKDGCEIAMDLPWNKFCGEMTGLWQGPGQGAGDFYVLGHNDTTDELSVWWDTDETPAGSWTYGYGNVSADRTVVMQFDSFNLTGEVATNNSMISGGTWGAPWVKKVSQTFPAPIHTVHMIFMNHLDVGYASYINNIDNEYFHKYYSLAIDVANGMRKLEGTDRFVYITHPWLLNFFYECPCADTNTTDCPALSLENPYADPLQCPSQELQDNVTAAIKRGDIVWHAAPFNLQAENMSPELFEAGIRHTRVLDKAFYGDNITITMSDRDVIYVTRSVIPLLNKYNVTGLTIGSNGANYPPQVPKLHLWRDPATGAEVVVAYHPYGYGGYSKSTCAGPGQCGDCAEAPNGVALCTEFRTDNTGPPTSTDEVLASLDAVRKEYPKASVFASTFDNFVRDVWPIRDKLPVIETEVGDTWMYGAPSDPLKMAQNREIQRIWIECLNNGRPECQYDNHAIQNMTRFLMKAPEHTWGIPGISGWGGGDSYEKAQFLKLLNTTNFLAASATWAEQRFYNELAIRALEHANHPLAGEVRSRVNALSNASAPDLSGFKKLNNPTQPVELSGVQAKLGFDYSTGAINVLEDLKTGTAWASDNATLAGVVYHTLNDTDWMPFTYDYINGHGTPAGFWKPGSNNYSESKHWFPQTAGTYLKDNTVVAHVVFDAVANTKYGCPKEAWINATLSRSETGLAVDLSVTILGKAPTMIGESTMITFRPAPALAKPGAWAISKLGSTIDPENVQDGGNQFNHGSWEGLTVKTSAGKMTLSSLDAPNFNPMTEKFPFGNGLPAGSPGLKMLDKGSVFGMAVNVHNNLWNTNYPLFYPYFDPMYCDSPTSCRNANQIFRFSMQLGDN